MAIELKDDLGFTMVLVCEIGRTSYDFGQLGPLKEIITLTLILFFVF